MKRLVYQIDGYTDVYHPETDKTERKTALATIVLQNPTAQEIAPAAEIANNGEYTIEDDGVEKVSTPTQMDRLEAQVTYTAMMTDTLLEV